TPLSVLQHRLGRNLFHRHSFQPFHWMSIVKKENGHLENPVFLFLDKASGTPNNQTHVVKAG
ncbi:hypothetical protein SLEP1_g60374, partial [Rubroshorea leprosula]